MSHWSAPVVLHGWRVYQGVWGWFVEHDETRQLFSGPFATKAAALKAIRRNHTTWETLL